MYDIYDLFLTLIPIALATFWWMSFRANEMILKKVKQHCHSLELQLLDQTVSLHKIKLKKLSSGLFALQRIYHFEFTITGDERYQAKAILTGRRMIQYELPPYIELRPSPAILDS